MSEPDFFLFICFLSFFEGIGRERAPAVSLVGKRPFALLGTNEPRRVGFVII